MQAESGVVLRLTVRNHPGVMSHVCGLFARRGFNVEGILCVPIGDGARSGILLLVAEDERLEQLVSQLRKLEDVLEIHREPGSQAAFEIVARRVRPHRFRPGRITYDGPMSAGYRAGRALSAQAAEAWRLALTPYLGGTPEPRLLDLGSGIGRFSTCLADWFDARVVAIEPSGAMRAAARRHPRVTSLGGRAEAIPLHGETIDVAWLSNTHHHVFDLGRCACELWRVLRPGGRLLVRGAFPDRPTTFTVFEFFPAARRVLDDFPTLVETVDAFCGAGFDLERIQRVVQQICPSTRALAGRARLRADTTLALLTDEEFARGLAALEQAADAEVAPVPALETLDLVVFRRPTAPAEIRRAERRARPPCR